MDRHDLYPEDLVYQDHSGQMFVNHELIRQIGLFNLNRETLDKVLKAYRENASKFGEKDGMIMQIFIRLTEHIQTFPFPVITNFTSGPAYEYNMDRLEKYASKE